MGYLTESRIKSEIMVFATNKTQEAVISTVKVMRNVPKRLTAGVAIGMFELFLQIFPNAMSEHWQGISYKTIGLVGATGIADWAWRNRKQAFSYIKNLFTKKKKEN
jgi:hypothetical protein